MTIYKILFLFLFFIVNVFGNVQVTIPDNLVKGNPLVFSIEVSGNNIKFPDLSTIDGNSVSEISSSSSTNIINSQITKKLKKIYSLYPTKDFTLPSLEFVIDSKTYYTTEKKVQIISAKKTKSDIFDLNVKASNQELFVGENFILTLVFKYKKDAQIVDLSFEKPNFENFWFKQLNDTKQYEENDFVVQELKFLMFPLKQGNIKIEPISIQAQMIDMNRNSFSLFSGATRNIKIYSNELEFNVKALPTNIKLIGDFEISSKIDKTKVKKGEAISYVLNIKGSGNIDDLQDFKLDVNDATIYENKPEIKSQFVNNEYKGGYTKTFSIIPNKSLIIPSITLKYFDKNTQKIISKNTDEYKVEVEDISAIKNSPILEKNVEITKEKELIKIVEKSSVFDKIIFFCLGIITSLLILGLYFYVINIKNKKEVYNTPLIKKVKKCDNKSELLKVLAAYLKIDSRLDELIFKLEKNEDIKTLKKEIIQILKQINL